MINPDRSFECRFSRESHGFPPPTGADLAVKVINDWRLLMSSNSSGLKIVGLLVMIMLASIAPSFSQSREIEDRRSIWPPEYRQGPPAKGRSGRYRRSSKPTEATPNVSPGMLGITIWRLRPSQATDQARILVTKNNAKTPWTPERVSADTTFSEGQLVRLSVEVPRTGYLYVIDREQYADGSTSDPYLIFPLNSSGTPFKVAKARIVELPGSSDETPGFEFNSYRKDGPPQTAELLTFIVSPEPIPELRLASSNGSPVKLMRSLAEDLEARWGTNAEQLEFEGGSGRAYTPAERNAAKNRALTNGDLPPQTVFRLNAKPGSPYAIKLPLRITS